MRPGHSVCVTVSPTTQNHASLAVQEGGPGSIEESSESQGNPRNPLRELNVRQKEE